MTTVADRIEAARQGSVRAIARLLSEVEDGGEGAVAVARALTELPRRAQIVGITGAPGAGKSTLTAALLRHLRSSEEHQAPRTVAVLAVDPSSPFSGGALLGDRVRMADHVMDRGVFIRSMSSRGHLGGLSAGTPAAVDLMSALGFDMVIIETVGVGQSEVDVMNLADSVAVVLAPGMGDAVQAAKAGIMEIADILVVNKADHAGARNTARELRAITRASGPTAREGHHGQPHEQSRPHAQPHDDEHENWQIPVLKTVAEDGTGVAELLATVDQHHAYLADTGWLAARQATRATIGIESVVMERLRETFAAPAGRAELARAAESVIGGDGDFHRAAGEILDWLRTAPSPDVPAADR